MFSVDMLVRDKLQNAQQLMPILEKTRMPLRCFVSSKKLINPACTSGCAHPERVELSVFFEKAAEAGKWICPVCGVQTSYAGILVDKLLREAIVDLGSRDIDEIEVFQTHEWIPVRKLTDTHVLMQQVFKFRNDKTHVGQREATVTDTYMTKKRSENRMASFRAMSLSVRKSSITPMTPALKTNTRVKRKPYIASTAYWFPWNEPFTYKYNFEEMAFDRIFSIYNISFLVLQATILYTEAAIYCLGGVSHQYISQSSVLLMSEEAGAKRCASMKLPRHSFPGVILNDIIYVFGGLSQGGFTDSCEKMHLDSEIWEPIADISEPKAASSAVALCGAIFVVGGSTNQIPFSCEIERYTPADNSWSIIRTRLPYGLVNSLTFPLPSRPAFVVLGGYGDTADGKDVMLVNVQENNVSTDFPKLKTHFTEPTQFPVMYDHVSNVLHLLTGDGEKTPVSHSYYNIDGMLRSVAEGEDVNSPQSKTSQFVTPSTKSEINA